MKLEYFEQIDLDEVEEYYSVEATVGKKVVELDLNFEEPIANRDSMAIVKDYLHDLEENLENAKTIIGDDWDLAGESETARFFVEHHLGEFNDAQKNELFGDGDVTRESLLNATNVSRIGFYPEDDDAFVVIDVVLKNDVSNYIMAIALTRHLELSEINMDS